MLENGESWNPTIISRYFWEHDAEVIMKTKIAGRGVDDVLAWHYEKVSIFTVRIAYQLAMQLQRAENGGVGSCSARIGERPAWKVIWSLKVP